MWTLRVGCLHERFEKSVYMGVWNSWKSWQPVWKWTRVCLGCSAHHTLWGIQLSGQELGLQRLHRGPDSRSTACQFFPLTSKLAVWTGWGRRRCVKKTERVPMDCRSDLVHCEVCVDAGPEKYFQCARRLLTLWNAPYWLSGGVDKKGQAVLLCRARSNCSSCSPCTSKLLAKPAVHVSDV